MRKLLKTFKQRNMKIEIFKDDFSEVRIIHFARKIPGTKLWTRKITLLDLIDAHDLLKDAAIYIRKTTGGKK